MTVNMTLHIRIISVNWPQNIIYVRDVLPLTTEAGPTRSAVFNEILNEIVTS